MDGRSPKGFGKEGLRPPWGTCPGISAHCTLSLDKLIPLPGLQLTTPEILLTPESPPTVYS